MYQLHIGNKNYSSWSMRPWILMRAINLPFNEHLHLFAGSANLTAFKDFSPTAKVPCLHDDNLVIWDSLAIAEYLAEQHAEVWPRDVHARAWARCASAEMHSGFPALRNECSMSIGVRIRLHAQSAALQADLHRMDALWTDGLQRFGGPWLAGASFTAVDAFFAPVAMRIQTYGLSLPSQTGMAYASRLQSHPAVLEWQAAALLETARDAAHEDDIMACGVVLQDLRAPSAG